MAALLIRELNCHDLEAYASFRRELWPSHAAAGCWEVVLTKYFQNPHRWLCPGSGLYGYFQGEQLVGTMGAYPMPVTLNGAVHPGHMLVDWAILPNFRMGPVAGQLWNNLAALPGRKFASVGSQASQKSLQRRGAKIESVEAAALLAPITGLAAKLLEPKRYSVASPLHLDVLEEIPGVALLNADQVRSAVPADDQNRARVERRCDFWRVYCAARIYNGAFALRITSPEGDADVVVRITEEGKFRFGMLLSAHLNPYSVQCSSAVGRLLRKFLVGLRVSILYATETDAEIQQLVKNTAYIIHRSRVHWWCIPTSSDSFRHDEVAWWLTSADRDSIYGGVQPYAERENG